MMISNNSYFSKMFYKAFFSQDCVGKNSFLTEYKIPESSESKAFAADKLNVAKFKRFVFKPFPKKEK